MNNVPGTKSPYKCAHKDVKEAVWGKGSKEE